MFRQSLFCVLLSTLALGGCINRAQTPDPLTRPQLNTALTETEMRLSQQISQQCEKWETQQSFQGDQLQQLSQSQRELNTRLAQIDDKLDHLPQPQQAKPQPAKAAVCPPPQTNAAGGINNIGNKVVVGGTEWLWIEAVNRVYEARVDTGATTSSISALDITPFEKDGKRWVRFRIAPDDSDDSYEVEAPLVRYVRIRQASSEELDRRPVAKLTVRLGKMTEVAEFTLTDRTQMTYPILLGREFLQDVAVVDVARKNIQPKPEIVQGQPQPEAVSKTKKK
jgi:hypothetical protein